MSILITAIPVLMVIVLTGVVVARWGDCRRVQAEMDNIVFHCLNVTQAYESLVSDVTEPYGGVLCALDDVSALAAYVDGLPDGENKTAAQGALTRLDTQLRIVLNRVAGRYRLTPEDKRRCTTDDGEAQ